MDLTVVGLGEVGSESFKEFSRKSQEYRVHGYDINSGIRDKYRSSHHVIDALEQSDVYIIAVYLTNQVEQVLNQLDLRRRPLISIESTLDLTEVSKLEQWASGKDADIVTCPHRFNPNDPAHYVFNLDRVIGGTTKDALARGIEFYGQFMDRNLIHPASTFFMAALSKTFENAHRANEIILAQEYKTACEHLGISFDELRLLANTKWNIDIKEARDGVKGKCLPKDHELLRKFFDSPVLEYLHGLNETYKRVHQK